jgi:2-amino-4-hydroxy-6-hydroxymethyldihydropteridine diphosphokinase
MNKSNINNNKACLLLGSNLGNKTQNIIKAENEMSLFLKIIKYSSFYESKSWGYDSKNSFINRALLVESSDSPLDLLYKFQQLEKKIGRDKNAKKGYQDRLIDIDILTFNEECISHPKLIIPHPRIAERKFTILPLLELYDKLKIPGINLSANHLLMMCNDKSEVRKINV